ncbi:MAG TPA: DUF1573 domain-containing protein [Caulobacteraceae bacterium]|jgi:hypothetical protein|nr:DUF1573 domain-containing protein [Caulobacteraceae bacterium]
MPLVIEQNKNKRIVDINGGAQVRFSTTSISLGIVSVGTAVTKTFTFTSTGKAPPVALSVVTNCACATAHYTQAPVQPGKSGTITVTYKATRVGAISQPIYVTFAGVNQQLGLRLIGAAR